MCVCIVYKHKTEERDERLTPRPWLSFDKKEIDNAIIY